MPDSLRVSRRHVRALLGVVLCTALVVLSGPESALAADVSDLRVAMEEDGVRVSFKVADAFPEDIMARIRSGLETSFDVHIRIDQDLELWFNRRICQRELRLSCTYDKLGSRYRIRKSIDGNVYESQVVETEAEMSASMTTVTRLKVLDRGLLRKNQDYLVRVKAELLSRYVLLVVPRDIDTPWREKNFTFN